MSAGPGGSTRRPPQTAAAVERQARSLARRASLPAFLAVLTAPFAAAFLWTLPLALFQMWFAARAFLSLRRSEPVGATYALGIAAAIGAALVVESFLALDPVLLAGDVLNVAVLAWAWHRLDRARAKTREAWGVKQVDVLDRSAAIAQRRSPLRDAERTRADAEDELAELDALGDEVSGDNASARPASGKRFDERRDRDPGQGVQ